jgi:endonuclease III
MRGATECAKRLRPFFSALRSKVGKVSQPTASDPITQLILGILSRDTPEARASEGLERLRGVVVDYNELRVIPPIELADLLGDFSDARLKCEDISRALNAIFAVEHTVSLERLAGLARKEVVAALDEIDGLEAYTRARVRLLGLRQHAIPLDEAMWALARRERLVDARCPLHEAQQFLERQIPEEGALENVALLKKFAWAEMGPAVRRREVERIRSVPPDRTSRNMLQLVGRLATPEAALDAGDAPVPGPAESEPSADEAGAPTAELPPATPRRPRAPAKPAPRSRRAPAGKQQPRPRKTGAASRPRAATGKVRVRPSRSVAKPSTRTGSA